MRSIIDHDGYDAFIFFDADFVSFSKPAYLRSFALGRALNASAIFALSMCEWQLGTGSTSPRHPPCVNDIPTRTHTLLLHIYIAPHFSYRSHFSI